MLISRLRPFLQPLQLDQFIYAYVVFTHLLAFTHNLIQVFSVIRFMFIINRQVWKQPTGGGSIAASDSLSMRVHLPCLVYA